MHESWWPRKSISNYQSHFNTDIVLLRVVTICLADNPTFQPSSAARRNLFSPTTRATDLLPDMLYEEGKTQFRCTHKPSSADFWTSELFPEKDFSAAKPLCSNTSCLQLTKISCVKLTCKWKDFWQLLQTDTLPGTCTFFDPLVKLQNSPLIIFVTSERAVSLWLAKGSWKQEHPCSTGSLPQRDGRQAAQLVFVSGSLSVNSIWKYFFYERDDHPRKFFQLIFILEKQPIIL